MTFKKMMIWIVYFVFFLCLSFPITALADGTIRITYPNGSQTFDRALKTYIIYEISGNVPAPLTAVLCRNGREIGPIAENLNVYPGRHNCEWKVGKLLSGSAPDASGYTIRVKTADGAIFGESEGSFSILSPDLFISDARAEKVSHNNNIHLWVTINRSGAKLHLEPSQHLRIQITSKNCDTIQIPDYLVSDLNNRGKITFFWTVRYPYRATAHIYIDAPSNTVKETDENNNTFNVTLTSGPPTGGQLPNAMPPGAATRGSWHKAFKGVAPIPIKPDLRITRARYTESGGKLWLTFHVVNATFEKGSHLDPKLARNGLGFSISHGSNWTVNKTNFDILNQRGAVDLRIEWHPAANGQQGKAVTITIDYNNRIAETNEGNNAITIPPYILKVKQAPRSRPSTSKAKPLKKKGNAKSTAPQKTSPRPGKRLSK